MNTESKLYKLILREFSEPECIIQAFDEYWSEESGEPPQNNDLYKLFLLRDFTKYGNFSKENAAKILSSLTENDLKGFMPEEIEGLANDALILGGREDDFNKLNELANSDGPLEYMWSQIEKGKIHPYIDPLTREKSMQTLNLGMERGIFTPNELVKAIGRMNNTWANQEYHDRRERIYKRNQTPFGDSKDLNDYGFQVFLGRDVIDTENESFCEYSNSGLLSFHNGNLENLFRQLEYTVFINAQTVLLSKDAGSLPERNDVCGRELKALNPEDLESLEKMFNERNYAKLAELRGIENPFHYQPQ